MTTLQDLRIMLQKRTAKFLPLILLLVLCVILDDQSVIRSTAIMSFSLITQYIIHAFKRLQNTTLHLPLIIINHMIL